MINLILHETCYNGSLYCIQISRCMIVKCFFRKCVFQSIIAACAWYSFKLQTGLSTSRRELNFSLTVLIKPEIIFEPNYLQKLYWDVLRMISFMLLISLVALFQPHFHWVVCVIEIELNHSTWTRSCLQQRAFAAVYIYYGRDVCMPI